MCQIWIRMLSKSNNYRQVRNPTDLQTRLYRIRTCRSLHNSSPSVVCHTEGKKCTLNSYVLDICIIYNAEWNRDMLSDLVFSTYRHRHVAVQQNKLWSRGKSASESDRFETQTPNPMEADFSWLHHIPSITPTATKRYALSHYQWLLCHRDQWVELPAWSCQLVFCVATTAITLVTI